MTGLLAVCKRELRSFWVTPLAWVLLPSFLLLQGGIFYSIVLHYARQTEVVLDGGPIQAYFGQQSLLMALSLLLLCPALTMRTLAEERRSGTMEMLLTAPITSWQLTLGKYLATLVTYALIWTPTLLYPLALRTTGAIDWSALATSYLALMLLGASYSALGLLMSGLAKSQLIALALSVFCLFGIFVLGIGEYVLDPGPLRDTSAYLSMTSMLEEMSQGLVDSRRLVLHLSLSTWALWITSRVIESWRQA